MKGVSVLHRHGEWCLVVNPLYDIVVSFLKKWMLEVVVAEWGCDRH